MFREIMRDLVRDPRAGESAVVARTEAYLHHDINQLHQV
jgi:hypothetical protein